MAQPEELYPEESHFVRSSSIKRRREFAVGRSCAHRALAQLGWHAVAIGVRPDLSPEWPDGIVGSISHTEGYAAAAVARQQHCSNIGIDVERSGHLSEDLWDTAFDSSEIAGILNCEDHLRQRFATILFSAKEAYYKAFCLRDSCRADLIDIHVQLAPAGSYRATSPSSTTSNTGHYAVFGDLVLAAICA
jgi:4'-phosphopantetheinyl transferase EntD